jgi:peptidoglycan/xylan/chitin deacetylase (PgdA/CDA1 family)
MPQGDSQETARRRRRVQRLKKIIVISVVTCVLLPNICCLMLFIRMHSMDSEIKGMKEQLEQLIQLKAAEDMSRSISPDMADNMESNDTQDSAADVVYTQADSTEQYKHLVYLTFDDGPSIYTDEILDILAEYDVKATFFVTGREDEASKASIKRIVSEGHTLGMHSYSHKYTEIYESVDSFSADFLKLQNYLYELTGAKSLYYRFPGGSSNTVSPTDMHEFAEYLEGQGVTFFDWNISSGDASGKNLSVDKIVSNSTDEISRWHTSIILMHDSADKYSTVEALPKIIEKVSAMDSTVLLPISEDTDTTPVQHIHMETMETNE